MPQADYWRPQVNPLGLGIRPRSSEFLELIGFALGFVNPFDSGRLPFAFLCRCKLGDILDLGQNNIETLISANDSTT